jgi:hypothetical protein
LTGCTDSQLTSQEAFNEVKTHVDSGGDASGRHNFTSVDIPHVPLDMNTGAQFL